LEGDSWEQIPSETYGRGYLEIYAEHLGLELDSIMKQYGRERELYARHCQDAKVEFAPPTRLFTSKFYLTPRFFVYTSVLVLLLLGGGVAGYQLNRFSSAPFLELVTPVHAGSENAGELVVTTDSVNVSGRTAMGASVLVNGKTVPVAEDGTFQGTVSVQKGNNPIMVEAMNGNGKKSSEIVNIVVK
jgi:Glucodextranase, domain B/Helix-turn-helix domain